MEQNRRASTATDLAELVRDDPGLQAEVRKDPVEALVRLTDPRHISDIEDLMSRGMSGDYSHWWLGDDGRWTRCSVDASGEPLPDLQAALIEMHSRRRRKARRR